MKFIVHARLVRFTLQSVSACGDLIDGPSDRHPFWSDDVEEVTCLDCLRALARRVTPESWVRRAAP